MVDIYNPQDISLLNEAREKLETIILRFCKDYGLALCLDGMPEKQEKITLLTPISFYNKQQQT